MARITNANIDLAEPLKRLFGGVLLATGDKEANTYSVTVMNGGSAASLTGYTCKGYFVRCGTDTIEIAGSVSGNILTVTLPENCYFFDGSYSLAIKLLKGNEITTVVVFDGMVCSTVTDSIVINEQTVNLSDIHRMEVGTVAVSVGAGATASQAIQYRTVFPAMPYVYLSLTTGSPNAFQVSPSNASATGFTLYVKSNLGSTQTAFVRWLAIMPK